MSTFHSLILIALMSASQFSYAQTELDQTEVAPTDTTTEETAAEQPVTSQEVNEPTMATEISRASDITISIRTRLNEVDERLKTLEDPSASLLSTIAARKEKLTEDLDKLDVEAMELAKSEEEFRASLVMDFQFTVVTPEQRMQYITDGKAVYDAMVNGFDEPNIDRRIDALNLYEQLNDNYRGLPEYAAAQKQYYDMLEKLVKHWKKTEESEERKRQRMSADRRQKLTEKEDKVLSSLDEKYGEPVRSAMMKQWIAPYKKSYPMTIAIMKRAEGELRNRDLPDREYEKENIGIIADLLTEYWKLLDQARLLMCEGKLEEAAQLMDNDQGYRQILRLNRNILPAKYRDPIVEQYSELKKEIMRRQRERRSREGVLTRQINSLHSSANTCESAIEGIYREISRAKENEERRKRIAEERKKLEESRRKAREEAQRKREAAKQ